ncbi:MAG: ATP-dependent helicase UvrD/PcrA [Solirubrobacteraceae bacterium]|nr:ATP-dependent helicase UvrD/PcrA [Solirubrobacteraceae bacterium]MEA2392847.1 ATP-dependent helicase UvrD/PcrA [Solirubrobacteraceae bacterium]
MPDPLDGLTPAQREVVAASGGPLLVVGAAGTGKTRTLLHRHAWLATVGGLAPEHVLALTPTEAAADALRAGVEDELERGFEELAVHTVHGFCARLLRDEALEAGLDPFVVPVTPADRLAMLLERVDELSLRVHDFQGNPATLLASVIARIDRLKEAMVTVDQVARWAAGLPGGDERAEREREFATVYEAHDRMLREQGALDFGDLLLGAVALLDGRPHVRARTSAHWRHVLVDDVQDLELAALRLVVLLGREHGGVTAAGDDDCAVRRGRGAPPRNLRALAAELPGVRSVRLERSLRAPATVLAAAQAVVAPIEDRIPKAVQAPPGGRVRFWRCAGERAQAQGVAAEAARLVRAGVAPDEIAVLVRSVRNEGQAVAVALEERAVPYRLAGATAFFQRAEVKDVLAWMRLLLDPGDAGAVVRALARPPVELRSIDIARSVQIARRRKLDMVGALVAATESPQLPPEARERILGFLKLHRAAAAWLDTARPDLFVHRLIDRLGLRRQQLFAAQADVVERLVSLARLGDMAAAYVRRAPQATGRDFARYVAAVAEAGLHDDEEGTPEPRPGAVSVMAMHAAQGREFRHVFVVGLQSSRMPGARRRLAEPIPDALLHEELATDTRSEHAADMRRLLHVAMTRAGEGLVLAYATRTDSGALAHPSPFLEEARAALGAEYEERDEELFGPDESLHATFATLRDELLRSIPRTGTRLGELRMDTDLDVAHGSVRYLELVKLAALMGRPEGQSVADALPGINAALLGAVTAQQREILQTSSLDDLLLDAERDARARAAAIAARDEPSLEPFLPTRGDGLLLSASDIETYRTCPLKYKFARVFRIPSEPTLNQRFGILVHQVLERYHQGGRAGSLDELLGLLEAGWRRGGFGGSDQERQLHAKADGALRRYHDRFRSEASEPLWFERAFTFRLGAHTLRGRVDRVDRLPDGGYELIDYKTGRPRSSAQLREDVQLSLYAVGAREAWGLPDSRQSYLYVLDDAKVPLPVDEVDRDWITDTVFEVADGILAQGFEPTPSYAACSICDYRIACPAAER